MPLPRYQPVKKKPKITGPSINDLDDYCLSKIIAYALIQAKSSNEEPYVKDNRKTERNLSLVSKRWYFLTQTQVGDNGVHKIDLEAAMKQESTQKVKRISGVFSSPKTPRRLIAANVGIVRGTKTPMPTVRSIPNYGILSQRNLTNLVSGSANLQQQLLHKTKVDNSGQGYNLRFFRSVRPKLLKYKHVQFCGSVTCENFEKLIIATDSSRVERLDLLKIYIENSKKYLNDSKILKAMKPMVHLKTLTYLISADSKVDASNALLWTIYQRAINLEEVRIYLTDIEEDSATNTKTIDSEQANSSFIRKLALSELQPTHPKLIKVVYNKNSSNKEQGSSFEEMLTKCDHYSILIKRLLSEERSIASFETNEVALIEYLIKSSDRLCTKLDLKNLVLSCPIWSVDILSNLVSLPNLGGNYLSFVTDNFDQISEVKTILENFNMRRPAGAKCVLYLLLKDQKFTDCEDKVKNLIHLSRMADVNVYVSALQRVSIDCCHLMWSTGRALQAITVDPPGKCIFKITLQTYPVKPNTVNPFEITIPFGRCSNYTVSSVREDLVRHREIMRSLKKGCYHQFVKGVRENATP